MDDDESLEKPKSREFLRKREFVLPEMTKGSSYEPVPLRTPFAGLKPASESMTMLLLFQVLPLNATVLPAGMLVTPSVVSTPAPLVVPPDQTNT